MSACERESNESDRKMSAQARKRREKEREREKGRKNRAFQNSKILLARISGSKNYQLYYHNTMYNLKGLKFKSYILWNLNFGIFKLPLGLVEGFTSKVWIEGFKLHF